MKPIHLLASLAIVGCTAVGWFVLGIALDVRSQQSGGNMRGEVADVWGPAIIQHHPQAWFDTPNAPGGRAVVMPVSSDIRVKLSSDPKQRGLVWHRTYDAAFEGNYVFTNPTRIPQTFYLSFPLPADASGLSGFEFRIGDEDASRAVPAASGVVTRAVQLPASGSITLHTAYGTRGTDIWRYDFPDKRRISGFRLTMETNFHDINFPVGTGSASRRAAGKAGWQLEWDYPDVIAAQTIGMEMPKLLNAGPVAARIAFFAPVSLLFFVTVMLLSAGMKGIRLHPMHVFFVSAGFFAFHLMFAYLVDLLPLATSFIIATAVSLVLVSGYLKAVGGRAMFAIALPAQLAYLIVFSASFFIDGLTGITLTVLSVATLALLMFLTARTDWRCFFSTRRHTGGPPPLAGK